MTRRVKISLGVIIATMSFLALVPPLLVVIGSLIVDGPGREYTVGLSVSFAGLTANYPDLLMMAIGGSGGFVAGLWLFAEARKS